MSDSSRAPKLRTLGALSGAVALAALASGCALTGATPGSGKHASEPRDVRDFDGVYTEDGIYATIAKGDFGLTLTGDDNLLPLVETVVEDGDLKIRLDTTKARMISTRIGLSAEVTIPELARLGASGGGRVEADAMAADDMTIAISGGGDGQVGSATGGALTIDVSGGGNAHVTGIQVTDLAYSASGGAAGNLSGTATSATISASGGSPFDGTDLSTQDASVEVSGGGSAKIGVSSSLTGNASGGGQICYVGSPDTVNVRTSGGSSVQPCP